MDDDPAPSAEAAVKRRGGWMAVHSWALSYKARKRPLQGHSSRLRFANGTSHLIKFPAAEKRQRHNLDPAGSATRPPFLKDLEGRPAPGAFALGCYDEVVGRTGNEGALTY